MAVIFLIHAIQTISPGFADAWLAKLQVNLKLPIREVIEAYQMQVILESTSHSLTSSTHLNFAILAGQKWVLPVNDEKLKRLCTCLCQKSCDFKDCFYVIETCCPPGWKSSKVIMALFLEK